MDAHVCTPRRMPKGRGTEYSGASDGQSWSVLDASRYLVHERGRKQRRLAKSRIHGCTRAGNIDLGLIVELPRRSRRSASLDPSIGECVASESGSANSDTRPRSSSSLRAIVERLCGSSTTDEREVRRLGTGHGQASKSSGEGLAGCESEHMFVHCGSSRPRCQVAAASRLRVGPAACARARRRHTTRPLIEVVGRTPGPQPTCHVREPDDMRTTCAVRPNPYSPRMRCRLVQR